MLTKEQWQDAARFAGVVHTHSTHMAGIWIEDAEYNDEIGRRWCPDADWDDFGPLLVLLLNWGDRTYDYPFHVMQLKNELRWARLNGSEQELMQAGLLLAAAVGATMKADSGKAHP